MLILELWSLTCGSLATYCCKNSDTAFSASVLQADRKYCLQYISCVPLLSTLPQRTESHSLSWLQGKGLEFLALFIPYHPLYSWGCDFSGKSWALALEVGHFALLTGVQWTVTLKPQRTWALLPPTGSPPFHFSPEHENGLVVLI